ncbi:MAG: chain-length determining protein [Prevotella sp.]|nr:chain-length determining protein [Prevotella sp.]
MNIYDLHHKWMMWRKKRKTEAEAEQEQNDQQEQNSKVPTDSVSSNEQITSKSETSDVIDVRIICKKMWAKKNWYVIVLTIVAVVSGLIIFDVPRYYTSETTMAPETDIPTNSGGALSNIASSMGFDISQAQSTDAIQPTLYPDLMGDNGFVTALFNIRIRTTNDSLEATYYDYLRYHQKSSWLSVQTNKIKKMFASKSDRNTNTGKSAFDPYHLSIIDDNIAEAIRNNVNINIDKKTGVISISTKAQDPIVCQIIADSVRNRLQAFITNYRTSKCRRDVEYYQKLSNDAKAAYEKTRHKYATISDENMDLFLETEKSKIEDLENTMQLQYNNYTATITQLEAARAKLRQNTPVFTTIEGAAVPLKPAGPKRMIFVAVMMILAFVIQTLYFIKGELFSK